MYDITIYTCIRRFPSGNLTGKHYKFINEVSFAFGEETTTKERLERSGHDVFHGEFKITYVTDKNGKIVSYDKNRVLPYVEPEPESITQLVR